MRGRRLAVIAVFFAVAGCSHAGSTLPPSPHSAQGASPSASQHATATVPNIFAAARNRTLRDADYDAYIDAPVTGADRVLARRLMKLMPPNQRGDFVYLDPATGHRVSNNLGLLMQTVVEPRITTKAAPLSPSSAVRAPSSSMRRVRDYSNSCGPTQPYTGSGPYGRMLSQCGFSGGIAFVNVDCGTTFLASSNDVGYLYFEVSGGTSTTAEGGLQYNSDSSIQPHIAGLSSSLNGESNKYACGQDLGIAFGTVKGQGVVFVEVGQVPSSYDPRSFWSGGQKIAFNNAGWRFITAPAGLLANGGPGATDAAGVPSPCLNCAIAKVTTIGQRGGDNNDGSYFGVDITNNYNTIHWMQVGMGNWLNDGCGSGGANDNTHLCTLEYANDQSVYYGGEQYYYGTSGDSSVVSISGPFSSGFGPWETYDGIWLPGGGFASRARSPMGAFSAPHPPTCTPDSYGYCVAQSFGAMQQQYLVCNLGTYSAQAWLWTGQQSWYIQDRNKGLLYYTETGVDPNGPSPDCGSQPYWSPGEPRSVLGDPNLP